MKLSLRRLVLVFFGISISILLVSRLPRNARVIVEVKYQERVEVVLASQGESSWTSRSHSGGMGYYLYNLNTLNKVIDAIEQDSKQRGYQVDICDNFLLRLVYTRRNRSL
jgi:predicted SPOUT superfamily RNA methylase MTH1